MTDNITITGRVVTDPRHIVTSAGLPITNFRLASTHRRFERDQGKWVDADTNWYTVSSFRHLAQNAAASVHRGDLVVVTGRLRLKEWINADKTGLDAEVQAESIGHDLAWGTSIWSKSPSIGAPAADSSADDDFTEASGVADEVASIPSGSGSTTSAPEGSGSADSPGEPPF